MQSIPLAVLKHMIRSFVFVMFILHAIHTACGIETKSIGGVCVENNQLHAIHTACGIETLAPHALRDEDDLLHAIHTACGIETRRMRDSHERWQIACNPYRLRY